MSLFGAQSRPEEIPILERAIPVGIDALELSVRSYNGLKRAGINTIEQLCRIDDKKLASIRNLDAHCVDEIINALDELGVKHNFHRSQERERS